MRWNWQVTIISSAMVSLVATCSATIIHVPQEYPTIQAGIDAAVDLDTVLVADGIYTGYGNRDIDFFGKDIVVMSKNGAETTVIDCQGSPSDPHRGVVFHSGEDSSAVLQGFTIKNGWAECGAGIHCYHSSPTIVDNIIIDNTTPPCFWNDGGGIMSVEASPTIVGNVIAGNVSGWGGGISFFFSTAIVVDNTVEGNACGWSGGGIWCDRTSGIIEGNAMVANASELAGGGIICDGEPTPTIKDNTIVENTAGTYGGGICFSSLTPITGNTITGNTAVSGGGIFCQSSTIIENNVISENMASLYGGGIYTRLSEPQILLNTIVGNTVDYYGGGIACWESSANIQANRITGNAATWHGGGIFCQLSSVTIEDNRIVGNSSGLGAGYGGGIYCWDCSPVVSRNTLAENMGACGAGIATWGTSSPIVRSNTIIANAAILGGAISCWSPSSASIVNSILWADSAGTGPEIYLEAGSSIDVSYSDIQGGWPGEGNVEADPIFVLAERQDYRLLWGSPCIDAGHPDSLDPDGTRSDMGAFFFNQDDHMTFYLTPDVIEVTPGGELGVTYTLINRWAQPEPFWVHSEATLPSGDTLSVMGPDQYTLPADFTVQQHLDHSVPVGAPLGVYRYQSRIGVAPSTLYDEDSFEFKVVEP
ncbi:MAG: hypothetical protein AMJ46_08035 [Latescibacteria bacterium DG_63]|uniref:Periplasmic copper-binding protein NosD beta helix domain-containing protein n=2 Tax=Bacteria division TA06 TaxID=1156500 RepID=A0A0S8JPC7_UNCT6|nr:MAG: hypothetical protein AMJ46_08035 [Latescibacteria bacterium DG_63]KPL10652.1 MAG: hypothetical protein AMJ71_02410 [candidate division TA06 bacterium SM1_40]